MKDNKLTTIEPGRVVFLDWLRVIACFMVMVVHAAERVYSNDYSFSFPTELDRWSACLINGFVRPAVPLFLMASAYLLVPLRTTTSRFFKKRLVRVAIPFVVWLALYSVLPAVWGEYSPTEAWNNLRSVYINFIPSASHLWFVYMLLGIYLIMPIISPWLEKVSRREEELFLLLWLFTTLSWHFHYYVGDVFGECWWNPYPLLYYVSGYVGFVVLTHYIKTHLQWSVKTTLWVAIPLFMIGYAYCVWWFYTRSFVVSEVRELELTWQTTSIAPVLMSFALFMLIKLISRPCFAYKAARSISDMSYGMYLMHMLILPNVYDVLSGMCITPCTIMATAAVTYILSYIITRLISVLPGGKYIVG